MGYVLLLRFNHNFDSWRQQKISGASPGKKAARAQPVGALLEPYGLPSSLKAATLHERNTLWKRVIAAFEGGAGNEIRIGTPLLQRHSLGCGDGWGPHVRAQIPEAHSFETQTFPKRPNVPFHLIKQGDTRELLMWSWVHFFIPAFLMECCNWRATVLYLGLLFNSCKNLL